MSIETMNWVWKHSTTKGSDRLVLLSLADNANDQGEAWPSIATIAKKCNLSKRYTIDILAKLEAEGHITKRERKDFQGDKRNLSNIYTIVMVRREAPDSEPRRTTPSEAGRTRMVRQTSPEPSINHQLEPEEEGASAAPTFELFGDDPQPTQQPKRKQAGSARPRDPLLSHPAITAYREVTRRQVPLAWRERVADAVGDNPQRVERWRRLLDDWCGSGWNVGNVKGMLERFNTAQPGRSNNGGAPRVTLSALGFRGPED
jgi:DNA-binding Lrp family transcriptional regulator